MQSNTKRYKEIITLLDERKIIHRFWNDNLWIYDGFIEIEVYRVNNIDWFDIYFYSKQRNIKIMIEITLTHINNFIKEMIDSDELKQFKYVDYNNQENFLVQLDKFIEIIEKK